MTEQKQYLSNTFVAETIGNIKVISINHDNSVSQIF